MIISTVTHVGPVAKGELVTIDVVFDEDYADVAIVQMKILYNAELLEVVGARFVDGKQIFNMLANINYLDGALVVTGLSDLSDQTITAGMKLMTITFKALEEITDDVAVTYDADEFIFADKNENVLEAGAVSGGIKLVKGVEGSGDVDGNGEADLYDLVKVFLSINGLEDLSQEQSAVADVTGDGIVNLNDVAKLFYMVNSLI